MKQHTTLGRVPRGFTIIEVIVVLAIVGILFFIIFAAVPQAQRNQRNHARKHTIELVGAALEEYYVTYGSLPLTASQIDTFKTTTPELTKYYGLDFRGSGAGNTYYPPMDTVEVQIGHWCNKYGNGDNATDPVAGDGSSSNLYVIWTLQEPDHPSDPANRFTACADNYDHSPSH